MVGVITIFRADYKTMRSWLGLGTNNVCHTYYAMRDRMNGIADGITAIDTRSSREIFIKTKISCTVLM
jgi:hypothetical protein